MSRFVIFFYLLIFLGTSMASERYIKIISPDAGSTIDPGKPVLVSGTGKGLFEGNLVVRFESHDGRLLVEEPTTMSREDISAAGDWQQSISLPVPLPESIRLVAFSPSPGDADAAITSAPVLLETASASAPGLTATRWVLRQYLNDSGDMQPAVLTFEPDNKVAFKQSLASAADYYRFARINRAANVR